MKLRRPESIADWFAYAYLAFFALVVVANIVIHAIAPW